MEHQAYLERIGHEAARLAAIARAAGPEGATPSTPDWNMAKLVKHTGTTHRWVIGIADTREFVNPGDLDLGLPTEVADYPDWFEQGAVDLVKVLGDLDPTTEMWSWAGDDRAGFWSRRMAHETTIHRWDAQSAIGDDDDIDADFAVDGIDERIEYLTPSMKFNPAGIAALSGTGESVHLHTTDTAGEWLLRFTPDGLVWAREHAKGDVALRGSGHDLLLYLVGRRDLEGLEVFGDASVLAAHDAVRHF
ncbi:MAG: maleylpyruvate isomerase family mycothiol-dependent enzyme [Acidimicrobiia bacterium]|nr:maleylpyruvate isomerase family mycothiol-dependent enzyme [Acidimicrobiia bacterium]